MGKVKSRSGQKSSNFEISKWLEVTHGSDEVLSQHSNDVPNLFSDLMSINGKKWENIYDHHFPI